MIPTLNIIGCGKLGQTLARLWSDKQQFTIKAISNTQLDSARSAIDFIGAGVACNRISEMPVADCWLIATPDTQIEACAQLLAQSQLISANTLIFHCSGSLSSAALSPLARLTHLTASVHPVHSFASPRQSLQQFAGSYCAYEGDSEALEVLLPAFRALGAELFAIDASHKTHYHAASVFACNYLVALLDASLTCFESAGVSRLQAQQILLPIVHQTVDNTLQQSPEDALTGPIARGDSTTVGQQLDALASTPGLQRLYQTLGQQTLEVARRQNHEVNLSALQKLLNTHL